MPALDTLTVVNELRYSDVLVLNSAIIIRKAFRNRLLMAYFSVAIVATVVFLLRPSLFAGEFVTWQLIMAPAAWLAMFVPIFCPWIWWRTYVANKRAFHNVTTSIDPSKLQIKFNDLDQEICHEWKSVSNVRKFGKFIVIELDTQPNSPLCIAVRNFASKVEADHYFNSAIAFWSNQRHGHRAIPAVASDQVFGITVPAAPDGAVDSTEQSQESHIAQTRENASHPRVNKMRIQHKTIQLLSIGVGAPVAGMVAYYSYGISPFLTPFLVGGSIMAAMVLTREFVLRCCRGTALCPRGPFEEDLLNRSDNEVLGDELARIGGKAARVTGMKLADNIGTVNAVAPGEAGAIVAKLRAYFAENGILLRNHPEEHVSVRGILGCGAKQLNPAIVTVRIADSEQGQRLVITAVAKEGLTRQRAGEEAAIVVMDYLSKTIGAEQTTS